MYSTESRRTKIRPPRKPLGSSSETSGATFDYDASWQDLSNAIEQIQHRNVSSLLYEQLYRKAYVTVLSKCGGKLYDNVSELITKHLLTRRRATLEIVDSVFTNTNEEFLKAVVNEWSEHLQMMKFISDVLMYLNRAYVKDTKKLFTYDLGIVLFDISFLRYNKKEIGERLVEAVISEITKSRNGNVITTRLYLAQVITMMEILLEERAGTISSVPAAQGKLSFYHEEFEQLILTRSESYFLALADEYLAVPNGTKYLRDVHTFIKEEENRLNFLLPRQKNGEFSFHSDTFCRLKSLMDNALIKNHIERIITYPIDMEGLSYWLEPVLLASTSSLGGASLSAIGVRDHTEELHMLYELTGRIDPDHKLLKHHLHETVISQSGRLPALLSSHLHQTAVTAGSKKPPSGFSSNFAVSWVPIVLDYHQQLLNLVQVAFEGDHSIRHSVYNAVKEFVNTARQSPSKGNSLAPNTNAPELLSIYMDFHIKNFSKFLGSKRLALDNKVCVDETEDFLNRSISFLTLLKDKDAFEAHYAAHFAKRFLNSKSISSSWAMAGTDLEELVIAKLGEKMGSVGSSFEKIVKMKKDVKLSHALTNEWKSYVTENNLILVDLELKVCNLSDWPKSMTKDYENFTNRDGEIGFIWPSVLRRTMRTFEEYWLSEKRNDNKTLYWSPKFGLIEMRITYPSNTYDISLSTFAGVIILLFAPLSSDVRGDPVLAFSEKRMLTYEEIRELTNIPEPDLKRQLQSIAVAARLRLLIKSPMTKEVNEGDEFRLNEKFKSSSTKVKVLTVSASSSMAEHRKEKQEESQEVEGIIEAGRKQLLNAAIVRIMKSRQMRTHNELIEELLKQLHNRFKPLVSVIKRLIEDLIDKEYLKRDDNAHNIYHYIA